MEVIQCSRKFNVASISATKSTSCASRVVFMKNKIYNYIRNHTTFLLEHQVITVFYNRRKIQIEKHDNK